jgi:hydroxymethylpyrimidine/phosphomethylpyrimidine kinase
MVATSGAALLKPEAVESLKSVLLPMAALVTPNIPEAEMLTDMHIRSAEDMKEAAKRIAAFGPRAVLVKGGHLNNEPDIYNVLYTPQGYEVFATPRIKSAHTHGTGCTLASAIATGLAQGMPLQGSVLRAQAYVAAAIKAAPGFGRGHGPLKHNFMIG